MAETPKSIIEQQRSKYITDMSALQANLEAQPGLLGKAFAAIGQFFTGFLPHIGAAVVGILPSMWGTLTDIIKSAYSYFHDQNSAWIKKLVSTIGMTSEMGSYLDKMLSDAGATESMLMPIIDILLLISLVKGFLQTFIEDTDQGTKSRIRNALPDTASAIKAMFINPSLEKNVREILQRYGLNQERSDMMIAASRAQLDLGTIQTLALRGELTDAEVSTRMRSLGFTDARSEEIKKTWSIIPGPNDIIRMAVREAFSEEQVTELGLDEAFPGAVSEWAAKVGLKDPWPKMFWRAHWELPSPSMGFEMLHRGKITEAELSGLLKALDYSPIWHERLKAIAYNVVTRVDARRLFQLGIYTPEQLDAKYREMGYSPDDAADLTAWTKVEYAQEDKEVSRSTIEDAYRSGLLDRAEAVQMIMSLGWSEEKANWILDLADFKALSQARDQAVSTAKELYLAGLASGPDVRDRLGQEQVQPDYIEALIERWDAEKLAKRKLPSKTDLDKFLKAGLVQESEYRAELERLGYSTEMADRYYQLNTKGTA